MHLEKVDSRYLDDVYGLTMEGRGVSRIEPCRSPEDRMARNLLMMKDKAFRAFSGESTPPIWLYRDFRWGPHAWPVRWSNVPSMDRHDCGLMAALSTEIYQHRGHCAVSVQMILSFNRVSTRGWKGLWRNQALDFPWCSEKYAYHEGTAIIGPTGRAKIWDPLGRFWLGLHDGENYEAIVAFKLCVPDTIVPLFHHNKCRIPTNSWLQRSVTAKQAASVRVDVPHVV